MEQEYQALQEGVGLLDLSYRCRLRITGRDRRSWLHGQVTQEINKLADGHGAYATILNPQGHMITDLWVYAVADALILDIPAGTEIPMAEYLDRFLIMERAEIEDLTESWALLSLQGPQSPAALATVFGHEIPDIAPGQICEGCFEGERIYYTRARHCGEDGFDLFVPACNAAALWGTLCQHRSEFAVHSVGWEAFNIRRLEAGTPWWGAELDNSIIPLEARLNDAISLTKGCYVGQEIIARIDARGQVNNLLAGFLVQGESFPPRGSEIRHDGKKVGRVSTTTRSLRLGRPIALGYLRRELQEAGTVVEAVTDSGVVTLTVTPLPFVPHDYPLRAGTNDSP